MNAEQKKLFGIEKLNVKRSEIPAVTHVDYSARIQTVHKETNPKYYNLLSEFKKKTGCGVIVNTSFNVRGEPIVNTPEDALRIVNSSKYPPLGKRGAGFGFAHDNYVNQNPLAYIEKANNTLVNIIQIETKKALENNKIDLFQVEGLSDLLVAETEAQQEQALIDQIRAEEQMKAQKYLEAFLSGGASYRKEDVLRSQLGLPWGGMT